MRTFFSKLATADVGRDWAKETLSPSFLAGSKCEPRV